jgi:acyl-CoA synthetase (AMP-forming)/AMP-acid ligase II/thioesterase domain-containing protein
MRPQTIHQILSTWVERTPDAPAILAPGRRASTYAVLHRHVERVVKGLHARGVGRADRVAIALPNGPEMVTAFLAVAAAATSAPLNPAYRAPEFDFYLGDLHAKALLLQRGADSPAREVARRRGIPVVEATFDRGDPAGVFDLVGAGDGDPEGYAGPDDVALVLHTSGTTSRPKIVPLTQRNVCTSAHDVAATLQLGSRDRCLNVMPLFHIHGLVAAVLASLAAGASIVCTPGFHADHFFEWLQAFSPTWYTAVPTMHQSVLAAADAHRDAVSRTTLRFIRSSSAALPPRVMRALEARFHAPVIEAYGMTEAAHQIASNPLPPQPRKPGTVGLAAGPEVAIMDADGDLLPAGQTGEIVIRGENVTRGYENDPSATRSAFASGWLRTGDQGVIDADGYLTITGRLKEIVNRGGEKIVPREVDEALLDHAGVAQAVAFAVPHRTLGEDLAAAVVLRDGASVTPQALREFAFTRLADHKVPSEIVILPEIPKGPTGKLQRIGLAETLTSAMQPEFVPPRSAFEEALARIWAEALGRTRVGIRDNFFTAGGDSLTAVSAMLSVEQLVQRPLHPSVLFRAPTIEQLARVLLDDRDDGSWAVPVKPGGGNRPLFCVPGHGGDVFTFVGLTRHLDPEQPVYVFRFPEGARQDDQVANAMLKDLAARYVATMRALQPEGPYRLLGFCFGGEVVFEMAQQLHAQGHSAELVGIIYAYLRGSIRAPTLGRRVAHHLRTFSAGNAKEKLAYLSTLGGHIAERLSRRLLPAATRRLVRPPQGTIYFPLYYPGRLTLFRPLEVTPGLQRDPYMGWRGLAADIELHEIPGDRVTVFTEPHVRALADRVRRCLRSRDG